MIGNWELGARDFEDVDLHYVDYAGTTLTPTTEVKLTTDGLFK